MVKTLDQLMRGFGVTQDEFDLIREKRGLQRSISMYIKSQCRNARNRPRITARQIQGAVAKVQKSGNNVTQWYMGMALGFHWINAARVFREVLWDDPKLEEVYERAKRR